MIDTLEAEGFGPLGAQPLSLFDLAEAGVEARARELAGRTRAIVVGLDRQGLLPPVDPAPFDTLFTVVPHAPAPWVSIAPPRWNERIAGLAATVAKCPFAASTAMHVLRMSQSMTLDDGLALESFAYSTLLGGTEFRRWRQAKPAATAPIASGPFVEITRGPDDCITIALAHPQTRNGMCAGMRDSLFEALAAALDDPTRPKVRLIGHGACFSTGGELNEFGSADDLALAHAVRTARSCAALLYRLGDRGEVVLHGACVGSGIEIPAAASVRTGLPGVFFQLPELAMGLMPGAGGTVSLPRSIGRHRTAAMILTGRRIDAATALEWGLLTGMASS
jgi:hypothetical protein